MTIWLITWLAESESIVFDIRGLHESLASRCEWWSAAEAVV
jgi:hypothetical protein